MRLRLGKGGQQSPSTFLSSPTALFITMMPDKRIVSSGVITNAAFRVCILFCSDVSFSPSLRILCHQVLQWLQNMREKNLFQAVAHSRFSVAGTCTEKDNGRYRGRTILCSTVKSPDIVWSSFVQCKPLSPFHSMSGSTENL